MTEHLLRELRFEIALLEQNCADLRAKIAEKKYLRAEEGRAPEKWYLAVRSLGLNYAMVNSLTEAFEINTSSYTALRLNRIESPKPLQRIAWPLLKQGRSSFLLGPKGAGKFISLLPIIARHAERARVIIVSIRKRCFEYFEALVNTCSASPLITEIPVSRRLNVSIICCTFAAFPEVARNERSFLCVIDGFDKLAEQGAGTHMGELLRVVSSRSTRIIASARRLTEATIDLAHRINFPIIAAMWNRFEGATHKQCSMQIKISYPAMRYDILKGYLRRRNDSSDVVLILVESKAAANHLESELSDDNLYAQSIHADDDDARELARNSLSNSQPGIFIAIPQDFSWLQEIDEVNVLIDLQSIRSPSAFSMRKSRVKSSGIFLSFLHPTDLQTAVWILALLKKNGEDFPSELEIMCEAYCRLKQQLLTK